MDTDGTVDRWTDQPTEFLESAESLLDRLRFQVAVQKPH